MGGHFGSSIMSQQSIAYIYVQCVGDGMCVSSSQLSTHHRRSLTEQAQRTAANTRLKYKNLKGTTPGYCSPREPKESCAVPSHPSRRNDVLCYSMSHVLVCLIVLVSCAFDASAGFLAAGNGQNRASSARLRLLLMAASCGHRSFC